MASEIRRNVETILMEFLDDYFKYDAEGIYATNMSLAEKRFSPSMLAMLDQKLRAIEDCLFNVIFLTDEALEVNDNALNLTDKILVTKLEDAYKFIKKGQRNVVFDVISKDTDEYNIFDSELSGYFEKEKTLVHK